MNENIDQLCANNIIALCVSMAKKVKSDHSVASMSGADFTHILYSEFLNFDSSDVFWSYRGCSFMDAGYLRLNNFIRSIVYNER